MMKVAKKYVGSLAAAGLAVGLMTASATAAVTVDVPQSGAAWGAWMNVAELDGTPLWGSGWGISDLVAIFDDGASTVTLQPNQIGDPNEYWYQDTCGCAADPTNPGGPGQAGNKLMEANLYMEIHDGSLSGDDVTFVGTVLSDSFTAAHEISVFIKDFAPDYSSVVETYVPISGAGAFSVTATTDPGAGRHVQYGFQWTGENVWVTDIAPFGEVVIGTVPEPASLALLGLGGLAMLGRKR